MDKSEQLNTIRQCIRWLNRGFGVFDDQVWKQLGVSYAESQILFAIREVMEAGRPAVARDLADLMQLRKYTISRILQSLRAQHFIQIGSNTRSQKKSNTRSKAESKLPEFIGQDQRVKPILLSKKGEELLRKLDKFGNQKLSEILDRHSADENQQFEEAFRTLHPILQKRLR